MSNIKVGDRVEIIRPIGGMSKFIGVRGTVSRVSPDDVQCNDWTPKGTWGQDNYYIPVGSVKVIKEKTMTEFKVGDRVKAIGHFSNIDKDCTGMFGIVDGLSISGNVVVVVVDFGGLLRLYGNPSDLRMAHALDNMRVGDEVIDDMGDVLTVAGAIGDVFFLADEDGHFELTITLKEMKDNDYSVVTEEEEPEDDTTELTLAEIAKKFKLPVDKLRIKESE